MPHIAEHHFKFTVGPNSTTPSSSYFLTEQDKKHILQVSNLIYPIITTNKTHPCHISGSLNQFQEYKGAERPKLFGNN